MTRFFHSGWRALAGLVLSAALFGLYSHGGNAYLLGFIALVPWLLALNTVTTTGAAMRSGVLMSILFVAAVFAWFGVAIGAYIGIGSTTGLIVILLTAPILQPQIVAFAVVRHLAGRRYGTIIRTLAAASAWVAAEWLMPKLLGDTIGHGLYPSAHLRQVADLGGAAGISFILILVNECIAYAITHRSEGIRVLIKPLVWVLCIPMLMTGYGQLRLQALTDPVESDVKPLRIGMVQSNIVDYERLRREMGVYEVVRHVLDTHYAMSREAIDQHNVDALLWSETVYPTTFGNPKSEGGAELDKEILDFVNAAKVPLVFGTYERDESGEYNAAAFVEPVNGTLGFYRKSDLFLFTEYLPAWLDGPTVRGLLPWAGSWKRGSGARVFPLRLADGREIPVLPMICLDDVNSQLAIDGARLEAQIILGMSNDSWFTRHPVGANLHLNVAAFRSIETRLPQVRVTSNGVSAVIDKRGTIIASTAMDEQKLLVAEVMPGQAPVTLMVAWGNWIGRAGFIFLMLLTVMSIVGAMTKRQAAKAAGISSESPEQFYSDAAVLSPFWRVAAGLLRVFAGAGLLWLGYQIVIGDETNPLAQIRMFAGFILAPAIAAWCITRAFKAGLKIENGLLLISQSQRRIEIPVKDIVALKWWKFPLPTTGVNLQLASGKLWPHGISMANPPALIRALLDAGATPALADSQKGFMSAYTHVRANVVRWRMDHFALKYIVYPLVPALPAFRLHQHIAFGGTFGEYYTYGLKAYVLAFLIWWASWAIGMALFGALLRVIIETGTALSMVLRRESAADVRHWLEMIARLLFFVVVPAWLLINIWPN